MCAEAPVWRVRIALLGSTGSIGRQVLDVGRRFPDRVEIVALTARSDVEALLHQVREVRPRFAAVTDPPPGWLPGGDGSIATGPQARVGAAALPEADLVIIAVVGTAGLPPALAALEAGKPVALATKEALVTGGHLMTEAARRRGVPLLPIDSEHSAI